MRMHRIVGIAAATVLALGMLAERAHGDRKATDKAVAIVNGEAIAQADFDLALQRLPDQTDKAQENTRALRKQELLDLLVDELLVRQFLRKHAPPADAAVVRQRLKELENALQARSLTLQQYCRDTGQTIARLQDNIAATLQWDAYVQQRATDGELRRCFETNREMFEGATLRASHIFLALPPGSDAKSLEAAIKKLRGLRQEILHGADFAETARKESQDPSTAPWGGDIGYFAPYPGSNDPFIKAAMALQVGQVSDVVRAKNGLHIIQLTDRKAGRPTTYEKAKNEVLILFGEELRQAVIAECRKTAKIEIRLP